MEFSDVVLKKTVQKFMTVVIVAFMLLSFSGNAIADEKATKEECEAKVKEAIEMVAKSGFEETLKKIQDKAGNFVWKDTYVFAINTVTAKTLAHPVMPTHVGKVMSAVKDVDGKMFFVEFINTAKNQGSGWVKYKWPKPQAKTPSTKEAFIMKVPGHDALFGAGIYTD